MTRRPGESSRLASLRGSVSNFDRKKRTRFRDQQGILNILKGYGYEEVPPESVVNRLPGGRVYEATYRGQEVTIVLSIPSSLDTLDPFFRNNRDIDCWIVVDGELAAVIYDCVPYKLMDALPIDQRKAA